MKFQHNIEYIVRVKLLIDFRPHWVIMTQKTSLWLNVCVISRFSAKLINFQKKLQFRLNVIFALFRIAGINATNLKTYEQANTQTSSKESLKEKRLTFPISDSLFTWFNMQILNLCHRWHRRIQNPLKYLKWSYLQIVNG